MEQNLPQSSQKEPTLDIPGGPVAKNLPAKAGFDPWFGKERHATAPLNSLATTKPTLRACVHSRTSRHSDVRARQWGAAPLPASREHLQAASNTQCHQK